MIKIKIIFRYSRVLDGNSNPPLPLYIFWSVIWYRIHYFFANYLRIPFSPDYELEVIGLQRIFPLGDVVAAFFLKKDI